MIALQPMPHETPVRREKSRAPHNKLSPSTREERRLLVIKALSLRPGQGQLAATIGVTQPDVSRFISGHRPVPARCVPLIEDWLCEVTA